MRYQLTPEAGREKRIFRDLENAHTDTIGG